jgi:branched-chain amino acid transport system ATP-binding protein
VLRLDGVSAGYGGLRIVHELSMRVEEGEIVALVGANGAGKTTTLRTISGVLRPVEGTIEFRGERADGRRSAALVADGLVHVPEDRGLFGPLTVEENLAMGAFLHKREVDERVEEVAQLFPLVKARYKQRAGSLSGGERQLVAMARALMARPSVLLLDEPSAGLSPSMQDEVFDRIAEIARSSVSVLMVEQNAHRCLLLADRAYVLDQGVDAHTGSGEQLLHDPKVVELYHGTLARRA